MPVTAAASANDMAAFVLSPELRRSDVRMTACVLAIGIAGRNKPPSELKVENCSPTSR
jgi:hypothetical protein